ncbi:MAG TPA: hypothetical protein VHJ00_18465 [Bradyrhizobium sp.]|jgi:hypothetical protein|nr:hypothetical protein [Bradyrhizobium sp.]
MRKNDAVVLAARKTPIPAAAHDEASVRLVCLALTLSMVALACRIFSIW